MLIPTLAISGNYAVEERDITHISFTVVDLMVTQLFKMEAWMEEGIFRLSGSKSAMERVYNSFKNANPSMDGADIHDIASAFKHYLRGLEDPLIPMALYESLIATHRTFPFSPVANSELLGKGKGETPCFDVPKLIQTLQQLPSVNFRSLRRLMDLCARIVKDESINKMNPRNLGIVFGPTLLRSRDPYVDFANSGIHALIISTLIESPATFFPSSL